MKIIHVVFLRGYRHFFQIRQPARRDRRAVFRRKQRIDIHAQPFILPRRFMNLVHNRAVSVQILLIRTADFIRIREKVHVIIHVRFPVFFDMPIRELRQSLHRRKRRFIEIIERQHRGILRIVRNSIEICDSHIRARTELQYRFQADFFQIFEADEIILRSHTVVIIGIKNEIQPRFLDIIEVAPICLGRVVPAAD